MIDGRIDVDMRQPALADLSLRRDAVGVSAQFRPRQQKRQCREVGCFLHQPFFPMRVGGRAIARIGLRLHKTVCQLARRRVDGPRQSGAASQALDGEVDFDVLQFFVVPVELADEFE